ncbi:hypothetical protein Pyrfu_0657 [Pyrolobus fumarii 1A]|uniref:DUF3368 domain-containing protein n=1 Tax=Pyrolobus fumarii (strain DSM 11204 / 1A) TaxID=694429 RepID=G0EHF1_PYRF1|nr:DUF3368 domain-containing protein [Pyrolobus fumarii]AEM38526.1 hypothetical protein Pyrfu_0657 [Pyrolobus fumarii 1A]
MNRRCIVVNSSVVIALARVNLLDVIIRLYKEVIIPSAVYDEVVIRGQGRPGSEELEMLVQQGKARLLSPGDKRLVEALHDPLGLGEAEAIALALEHGCIVALDDRIARSKARSMGLKVIGTLGLLREAYDTNIIDKDRLIQSLEQLRQHGFRISERVLRELIGKLG